MTNGENSNRSEPPKDSKQDGRKEKLPPTTDVPREDPGPAPQPKPLPE